MTKVLPRRGLPSCRFNHRQHEGPRRLFPFKGRAIPMVRSRQHLSPFYNLLPCNSRPPIEPGLVAQAGRTGAGASTESVVVQQLTQLSRPMSVFEYSARARTHVPIPLLLLPFTHTAHVAVLVGQ